MKSTITFNGFCFLMLFLIVIIMSLLVSNILVRQQDKILKKINYLEKEETNIQQQLTSNDTMQLNFEMIETYISFLNIKYPDILLAIIKLETGNLTSYYNNNLCGMKSSTQRCHTYKDVNKNGYCIYDSWENSILDYAFFETKYVKNKSKSEWLEYLSTCYASDANYKSKLLKCM